MANGYLPRVSSSLDAAWLGIVRNVQQLVENLVANDRAGTTAERPDPIDAGAGGRYYDTDLAVPLWSDGTVWRDAGGVAV